MPNHRSKVIAVYPGTFDPVTFGHLDVIRRASKLFNELVVGIGTNPDKAQTFTPAERLELLRPHLRGMPNVRAAAYDGLTIDFVRESGARVMVRGIRDMSDVSGEVQLATINQLIGGIETIFLLTSDEHMLTSSTYVKQIYELGGGDTLRIQQLVPRNVAEALKEKLGKPRPRRGKKSPARGSTSSR